MKGLKYAYLALLGLWIAACGLRVVLPYLCGHGDLYYFEPPVCLCSYEGPHDASLPAERYAELNARLKAVQPEAEFCYAPAEHGYTGWVFLPLQPDRENIGAPLLSAAAEAVLRDWIQENEALLKTSAENAED